MSIHYEAFCFNLSAYDFGSINLLEVVERFEKALLIQPSDQAETVDNHLVLMETEDK